MSQKPIKADYFLINHTFEITVDFCGKVKMNYRYADGQLMHLSVFLRCNIYK